MVILHIASVHNTLVSGMDVAVPLHVNAQGEFAQVGFVNVTGEEIPAIKVQLPYADNVPLSGLPAPFHHPDLIVFHEVYKPVYLKLYRQAKAAGVPYIVIPHGCLTREAQRKKWLKKATANMLLFRAFIDGAAAIQFLSEKEKDDSCFGKLKLVGTNGVYKPAVQKTTFNAEGIQFLYVGRTEVRIKGLDLMLRAVHMVADRLRRQGARLVICGPDTGNGHTEMRKLIAKLGIDDLVELKEQVTGEEKERELLKADVFVQTSRSEGMPMGILEALSYGIPCLVTRGTRLGEIIERYDADWVAETDIESIAGAILQVLNERELWNRKARNGIVLTEENFCWEKIAQQTVRAYQDSLA